MQSDSHAWVTIPDLLFHNEAVFDNFFNKFHLTPSSNSFSFCSSAHTTRLRTFGAACYPMRSLKLILKEWWIAHAEIKFFIVFLFNGFLEIVVIGYLFH